MGLYHKNMKRPRDDVDMNHHQWFADDITDETWAYLGQNLGNAVYNRPVFLKSDQKGIMVIAFFRSHDNSYVLTQSEINTMKTQYHCYLLRGKPCCEENKCGCALTLTDRGCTIFPLLKKRQLEYRLLMALGRRPVNKRLQRHDRRFKKRKQQLQTRIDELEKQISTTK